MTLPIPTPKRAGRSRAFLLAALLAGTALSGAALPVLAETSAPTSAIQPAPARGVPDFADLVTQVGPAVVSITAQVHERSDSPFTPARSGQAKGSGFIVDADGTIVTNNHVVRDADKVEVQLDDGTRLPARIVGRDARTDLAVLHVDAGKKLPFLALGDSSRIRPGQWVVAVGNPFGLGGTVTAGIVSARSRDIGAGPYDNFIQIDAPINAGNSGGPLFSQDGKVVGVNTAILSPTGGSVGIGFAIPSDQVRSVIAQLEANGHVTRGYLGVETQAVTPAMAGALRLDAEGAKGALVAGVESDSPAAKAGLQPGDLIHAVNGTVVASPRELAQAVAGVAPGKDVRLDLVRDGAARSVTAQVATQPGEDVADANATGPNRPSIGLALAPLSPELRDRLDVPERVNGAVVAEVKPGSPAEAAGLRQGDVVVGVGGKSVTSPDDTVRAIRAANKDGKGVALRVVRDGHARFVAVPGTVG